MKPTVRKVLAGVIIALLVLGILFGVRALYKKPTQSNKLSVTTTFYPLYDFAKQIGGDKVAVTNMTPAGAEPHDYEVTPRQLADAQKSKVFVYIGGLMEPWSEPFLTDYRATAVRAGEGIELLSIVPGHEDHHDEGHAEDQLTDPHFWLDPVYAQKIVDNILAGLIKADPTNMGYYTSRAEAYKAQLAQLDVDYRNGLANCRSRMIVTSHEAFGYLAKRYNLEVVSISGITPGEDPSPSGLAEIAKLIREKRITHVFFESLASPKLAETLAKETGAKTAVFDPVEGLTDEDQKQGKDYLSVQRENLANLRTALACQ